MNRLPLVVTSKLRRCLPALLLKTDTSSMSRVASLLTQKSKLEWTQRFNLSSKTASERAIKRPEMEVKIEHSWNRSFGLENTFKAGFFKWNATVLQAIVAPYRVEGNSRRSFEKYPRRLYRLSRPSPLFAFQNNSPIGICATSHVQIKEYDPDEGMRLDYLNWAKTFDFDLRANDDIHFESVRCRKLAAFSRMFDRDLTRLLRPAESTAVLKLDVVWVFEESVSWASKFWPSIRWSCTTTSIRGQSTNSPKTDRFTSWLFPSRKKSYLKKNSFIRDVELF